MSKYERCPATHPVETTSRCHLFAGHSGPHEEVDTDDELTWYDTPTPRPYQDGDIEVVARAIRRRCIAEGCTRDHEGDAVDVLDALTAADRLIPADTRTLAIRILHETGLIGIRTADGKVWHPSDVAFVYPGQPAEITTPKDSEAGD